MASITRRGAVWRVRIRLLGQLLTKTLDTEEEAIAWAKREEARILGGETAQQIKATPSTMTVEELFDRYAREVCPAKGGGRWEQIRLKKIGKMISGPAIEVDGARMAHWRDDRLQTVSASSVNRELSLISAVYSKAMAEWRLPLAVNPVHTIEWPKKPHHRTRRVSDAERAAVIVHLGWDETKPPLEIREWVAWSFCLALETMMRQGEILKLTWQHVHLDKRFCHLPKTKNGHKRNVPLSSRAIALFRMLPESHPGNAVVDVNPGTFGIYFRRALKAAKIEDMHFHDTRREALTRTAKKLTNIAELARASGHRGTQSLMIYYEPDVTEIAEKLN